MSADALHIKNNIMRIVADTNDTAVLNQIIEFLEDLEDIRLYEEGMADDDPGIPIDEAFKIIEAARKESNIDGLQNHLETQSDKVTTKH